MFETSMTHQSGASDTEMTQQDNVIDNWKQLYYATLLNHPTIFRINNIIYNYYLKFYKFILKW